jgi:putative redox protein
MQHKTVVTSWEHRGLVFSGGPEGGKTVLIDGDGGEGPSPVDNALVALAGCTGSDVVIVLQKKRIDLKELRIEMHAQRRDEYPRRFTAIRVVFDVTAPGATEDAVRQAIDLSFEKYCSVSHSLNPDIPITYELRLQA